MAQELVYDCKTGASELRDYVPDAPTVPQSITPRQAKLALLGAGLLDQVELMMNSADRATEITWQYALSFDRDDAMLNALAAQLGLTSEQVDDLFRAATTL